MLWEKSENHVKGEKGKNNLEPSPGSLYRLVSPLCLEAEPGPLAMSYEEATGWSAEKKMAQIIDIGKG